MYKIKDECTEETILSMLPVGTSSVDFSDAVDQWVYIVPNLMLLLFGLRQANLVLIAYASSEGSGEPAHPRSLARTFAACSYKQ